MAVNEDDLAKARQEWRDAIEAARRKRQAREADDGPGKMDSPEALLDRVRESLAGMGDELARVGAKTFGTAGTFLAANVLGLQTGGAADRMANGIDKIERNTRPLRDAEGIGFA